MTPADDDHDPYQGPVPASAWEADARSRAAGRVQMFNATRPGGLDGWTISLTQYELLRAAILDAADAFADDDGTVTLGAIVADVQRRLGGHEAFPGGRLTNYVRFVKVDLEARQELQRVLGSSPQRIRRRSASGDATVTCRAGAAGPEFASVTYPNGQESP